MVEAPTSPADEIAKLVAFRDSGAITDEEFTAYKGQSGLTEGAAGYNCDRGHHR